MRDAGAGEDRVDAAIHDHPGADALVLLLDPQAVRVSDITRAAELSTRDFLKFLNDKHLQQHPGDTELSARIASYELAAKMQLSAAEVNDLSKESAATRELYGVNDANKTKAAFAGRVGAFEGANYEARGFFRPQTDCVMFTRDLNEFCAVCRRAIARMLDLYSR